MMRTVATVAVATIVGLFLEAGYAWSDQAAIQVTGQIVHTRNSSTEPILTAWAVRNTQAKDSLTLWALESRSWGEVLVGYQHRFSPWLEAGVSAGLETCDQPWRTSAWVWTGRGRLSLFTVGEIGGSGGWYLIQGGVKIHPRITAGLYSRRFVGTGLYAEIAATQRLTALVAITRYEGNAKTVIGLTRKF